MKQEQIMSGEIRVVGEDRLELLMKYGRPDMVLVEFKNDPQHVPCNPQQDTLGWEMHERDYGFVLIIKWSVSSARQIVWAVNFV